MERHEKDFRQRNNTVPPDSDPFHTTSPHAPQSPSHTQQSSTNLNDYFSPLYLPTFLPILTRPLSLLKKRGHHHPLINATESAHEKITQDRRHTN